MWQLSPRLIPAGAQKSKPLDQQYRSNLETMVKEQAEIITERTRRISEIQEQVIMSMAALIESRDNSTGRHVKNTKNYVRMTM